MNQNQNTPCLNLTDEDRMQDMLAQEKYLMYTYSAFLPEASCPQLREVLDTYAFGEEEIPVINNVSGKVETRDLREVLQEQICHSVHFTQSLQAMIDMGVELFIEIGPGHALSGFVRKTTKEVPVYHIDTTEDLEKVLKEVCPDGN